MIHRLSVEDLTNHIFKIIYNGPLRIMVQHQYKALNIDTKEIKTKKGTINYVDCI